MAFIHHDLSREEIRRLFVGYGQGETEEDVGALGYGQRRWICDWLARNKENLGWWQNSEGGVREEFARVVCDDVETRRRLVG